MEDNKVLSLYDALSFSVQKKSLLGGVLLAVFMLLSFIFLGCFLEADFSLFSAFRSWLVEPPQSMSAITALYQMASVLASPAFWSAIFHKILWIFFLFCFITFLFFTFELIVSKKTLFKQPAHFSTSFFGVAFGKFLLLWVPILSVVYVFLEGVIKSTVEFCAGFITRTSLSFICPFPVSLSVIIGLLVFIYLIYAVSLFAGRFSFASILNAKPFFKHITTVFELILNIIALKIMFLIGVAILCVIYWQIDSLWVCFGALMGYLIWMAILNSARFIFILPFILMGAGALLIQAFVGKVFFQEYLFTYMIGVLLFFCFFFIWSSMISAMAHLLAQTAYVFRFNESPAKDIKKKAPEKLRPIEELYDTYLKEHKNDKQDNYFDHV